MEFNRLFRYFIVHFTNIYYYIIYINQKDFISVFLKSVGV